MPTMGAGRKLSHAAYSVSKPQFERHSLIAAQSDQARSTSQARRISCSATQARGLLALRGVGPVNARLLLAQQIESVDMLKEIYQTTCRTNKQELQRYLMVSCAKLIETVCEIIVKSWSGERMVWLVSCRKWSVLETLPIQKVSQTI